MQNALRLLTESEQRKAVVGEAESWLGTKFHPEACVKGVGVDCGHFLIAVYRSVGLPVPEVVGRFPRDWHMHTTEERYLEIVTRYMHRVETPQPGDAVLFRCFKSRPMCHGGIVIDWPLIIHACDRGSVEYLDVYKSPLGKRELSFFSYWNEVPASGFEPANGVPGITPAA